MLHVGIWISRSGTSISIERSHSWINIVGMPRQWLVLPNQCQTAQGWSQGVNGNSGLSWSDSGIVLSETWSEISRVVFVGLRHFASKCEAIDCACRASGSWISKVAIDDFAATSMIFVVFSGLVDGLNDRGHGGVCDADLILSLFGSVFPGRLGAVNGAEGAQTGLWVGVYNGKRSVSNTRDTLDGGFALQDSRSGGSVTVDGTGIAGGSGRILATSLAVACRASRARGNSWPVITRKKFLNLFLFMVWFVFCKVKETKQAFRSLPAICL